MAPDPGPDPRRRVQPRFRAGGSGPGVLEPDELRAPAAGEASVLLGGHGCVLVSLQVFYSRRIGSPPLAPTLGTGLGNLVDVPEPVTIYGAGKLVGRIGSRWTVGALSALTAPNTVTIEQMGMRTSRLLAPTTAYNVFRLKRDFGGASHLGVIGTGATGFEGDGRFRDAYVGGADGRWRSANAEYVASGALIQSYLKGGPVLSPSSTARGLAPAPKGWAAGHASPRRVASRCCGAPSTRAPAASSSTTPWATWRDRTCTRRSSVSACERWSRGRARWRRPAPSSSPTTATRRPRSRAAVRAEHTPEAEEFLLGLPGREHRARAFRRSRGRRRHRARTGALHGRARRAGQRSARPPLRDLDQRDLGRRLRRLRNQHPGQPGVARATPARHRVLASGHLGRR